MKKAVLSDPRSKRKPDQAPAAQPADRPAPSFKPPLKPRPKLFYGMLGLVGLWVGLLLTLYFVTVFPHRNEAPPHRTVEPNSGASVPRSGPHPRQSAPLYRPIIGGIARHVPMDVLRESVAGKILTDEMRPAPPANQVSRRANATITRTDVRSHPMARKTTLTKKSPAKSKAVSSSPVRNSPIPKVVAKPATAPAIPQAATKKVVTQEMIATRAYEISRSGNGGSEFDNWLRAERELRGV